MRILSAPVDPQEHYAYVAHHGASSIPGYRIEADSGRREPLERPLSTAAAGPYALAVARGSAG